MTTTTNQAIDDEKLGQFMGKVLSDFGGGSTAYFSIHRRQTWIIKPMYDFGKPITSQRLANLTGTSERYVREWLANQGAGGYLTYDPLSQRYSLPMNMLKHWLMKIVLHMLLVVFKL